MSDKPEDSTPTYGSPGEPPSHKVGSPGEPTVRETLPRFPMQVARRMVQMTSPELERVVEALKQFDRGMVTAAEAHKLLTTTAPIYRVWERNVAVTYLFWARFYAGAAQCLGPRFWPYVRKHPHEFPVKKFLQRFLRIARCPDFYKPENMPRLPRNVQTLDELKRLAEETPLQPLFDAEDIHQGMTIEDALALRQKFGGWQPGRRRGDRRGDPLAKVRQAILDYVRDHHGQKALLLGFLQAELLRLDPGAEVTLSVEVPDAGEPEAENDDDDDEEAR
jgi:hypothetical protein